MNMVLVIVYCNYFQLFVEEKLVKKRLKEKKG